MIYAFLCLVLFLMFESYKIINSLEIGIFISIIYGALMEVLQAYLTSYRTFDIFDILVNIAGILVMAKVINMNKPFIIKKLETFM